MKRLIRIAGIAVFVAFVVPLLLLTGKLMERVNFHNVALTHLRAGEIPRAAATLARWTENEKDCLKDPRFFILSGMIFDAQGQHDKAQKRYEHALSLCGR